MHPKSREIAEATDDATRRGFHKHLEIVPLAASQPQPLRTGKPFRASGPQDGLAPAVPAHQQAMQTR